MRSSAKSAVSTSCFVLVLPILWAALCTSSPAAGRSAAFELEALNRTFTEAETGLGVNLVPVRQGAVTVLVSSPEHAVTVHANTLRLRPVAEAPEGTVDARLEVDLEGAGKLVARVEATGSVIRDTLRAPRQSVEVAARLRLVRAVDGYLLEVIEPYQPTVDFRIESGVARQMVTACGAFRLFLGALDCDALAAALALARVPMPEPGARYWLPSDALTATDRQRLDRHAAGATQEAPGAEDGPP